MGVGPRQRPRVPGEVVGWERWEGQPGLRPEPEGGQGGGGSPCGHLQPRVTGGKKSGFLSPSQARLRWIAQASLARVA